VTNPSDGSVMRVGGRVVEPSRYRPSSVVRLEDTVAWWGSLGLFGGLAIGLGILAYGSGGSAAAVGGVALFLATAVVAGAERYEPATALAGAGIVWSSVGISLYLGTDPSPGSTFVVLSVVGAVALVLGGAGAFRVWARERSPGPAGPQERIPPPEPTPPPGGSKPF
jgi:hypothetical protein